MERGKEQTPTQVTDQGKAGEGGMLKEKDRILKALDSIIFMDHLKARNSPSAGLVLTPSSATSGERRLGRPWDRGDLYLRLQTFKPSTWFAKPVKVGAQECARRGWENSGEDELTCEVGHAHCITKCGVEFCASLDMCRLTPCPFLCVDVSSCGKVSSINGRFR